MTVNFKLLCDMDGQPDVLNYPVIFEDAYGSVSEFSYHLEKIAFELMKENTVCYCVKCSTKFKDNIINLIANA